MNINTANSDGNNSGADARSSEMLVDWHKCIFCQKDLCEPLQNPQKGKNMKPEEIHTEYRQN